MEIIVHGQNAFIGRMLPWKLLCHMKNTDMETIMPYGEYLYGNDYAIGRILT